MNVGNLSHTTPVLMISFGNLYLTRSAISTVLPQTDHLFVIDNASWDNTPDWLRTPQPGNLHYQLLSKRRSLAAVWNMGLGELFALGATHVLVVNNDLMLQSGTVQSLRSLDHPFITGVGVSDTQLRDAIIAGTPWHMNLSSRNPHPDFSCFMIREDTWRRVGPFDENFHGAYCEDLDYHVRLHHAGIRAESVDLPFYHSLSAAVKHCPDDLREQILTDADRNRKYFTKKWNVPVPTAWNEGTEYYKLVTSPLPESGAPRESSSPDSTTP